MKITDQMTDEAVMGEVGARLARVRLARNLTQGQLAEQAGLGVRTLQRLELGAAATHLSGLLRVCRVLGLLDRLESFIPEPTASPIAQMKLQGKERRRASGRRARRSGEGTWSWGEES